jgi:hypothetical protein
MHRVKEFINSYDAKLHCSPLEVFDDDDDESTTIYPLAQSSLVSILNTKTIKRSLMNEMMIDQDDQIHLALKFAIHNAAKRTSNRGCCKKMLTVPLR